MYASRRNNHGRGIFNDDDLSILVTPTLQILTVMCTSILSHLHHLILHVPRSHYVIDRVHRGFCTALRHLFIGTTWKVSVHSISELKSCSDRLYSHDLTASSLFTDEGLNRT